MSGYNFRAGVMIVVSDSFGRLMAFERCNDSGQWQLPQGGIDRGETPDVAAWRELREETGLSRKHVELVREYPYWTIYAWPKGYSRKARIGQAHRWFFFRLLDDTTEPTPDGEEFCGWKWMSAEELIETVVPFRRQPYQQVLGGGL